MEVENKYYCKRCGKELKGKDSIRIGYGPLCIKKLNPKNKSVLSNPSNKIELDTDVTRLLITNDKVKEIKEEVSNEFENFIKSSQSISLKDNTLSIKLSKKQFKKIQEQINNILGENKDE